MLVRQRSVGGERWRGMCRDEEATGVFDAAAVASEQARR
jgi:hypothetical protein